MPKEKSIKKEKVKCLDCGIVLSSWWLPTHCPTCLEKIKKKYCEKKDTRVQLKHLRNGAIFEAKSRSTETLFLKTVQIKDNNFLCMRLDTGSHHYFPIDYKPLVREIIIDG